MKINLIYNQKSLLSTWEDILSLLYPNATQSCFPITEWNRQTNQEDVDLVFYISMNVTDSFNVILGSKNEVERVVAYHLKD